MLSVSLQVLFLTSYVPLSNFFSHLSCFFLHLPCCCRNCLRAFLLLFLPFIEILHQGSHSCIPHICKNKTKQKTIMYCPIIHNVHNVHLFSPLLSVFLWTFWEDQNTNPSKMRELAQWVKGCHWQENKWDVQSVRPQGCDESSACFRSSENRAFLPGNAALCTHGNAVGICRAHSWIPLAKINRVVPEAFPSWCGISNTGSYCVLGHCHEAALCPAVPVACWNPGALKVRLLPEVAVQSGLFHGGSYRCCPTSPSSCRKQKKGKEMLGLHL